MTPSEASELAATAIDRLTPCLPGIDSNAPARRLYETIAGRMRLLGEQKALAELVREPRNSSLVKRLLTSAITKDPGYAAELTAAAEALPPAGGSAEPPATAGPPPGRRPRRLGLWAGLGATVVVVLLGLLLGQAVVDDLMGAGGLTADSTCEQYRQAPSEERVAAIRQIGLAKGISGADSPLVMTAVDQLCDAQPAAKIGDLVARLDG